MKNQNISFFYGIIIIYLFSNICKIATCGLEFLLISLNYNAHIIAFITGSMLFALCLWFLFMKKIPSIKVWFFIFIIVLSLFSNNYLSTWLTVLIRDSESYTQNERNVLYGIYSTYSSVIYVLIIIFSFVKYYYLKKTVKVNADL
jgi:hypothetical protein